MFGSGVSPAQTLFRRRLSLLDASSYTPGPFRLHRAQRLAQRTEGHYATAEGIQPCFTPAIKHLPFDTRSLPLEARLSHHLTQPHQMRAISDVQHENV